MSATDDELVRSPDATPADLHRIAADRPDLRALVAAHPNAYPDLLSWLRAWDDPAINDALDGRDADEPTDATRQIAGAGAAVVPPSDAARTTADLPRYASTQRPRMPEKPISASVPCRPHRCKTR